MTKFKYILLFILLPTLAQQAAADYKFDGMPIVDVTHGTIAGGVYVAGGHGNEDAKKTPYTESFDVPGTVIYARLYVGVWGGTPEYTGTVETTINGETLGTLNLAGNKDSNPNVVCTGYGVYLVTYEVTSRLTKGANTASVVTAGDIDGRVYGITLAAVYESENDNAPEVEYWINDGHENLNYKTPHDSCTTAFSAATSTNPNASLTVGYLCGDPGEKDYLHMNGNPIGGNDVADSMGDSAYGFDIKTFDVSSYFDTAGNTLTFERGDESAVHPFVAVLMLSNGTTDTPLPEGTSDLTIMEIKTPSRVFAEKDNTIGVVVRNDGDYNIENAFTVELLVDSIPLGSISVPDLGARENETVRFIWNPHSTGDYELNAKVDANSVIEETDEANNEKFLTVSVVEVVGYYGDDSIETFEHDIINGSLVYTIGNSSYSKPPLSPDDEYAVGCNLTLPDAAIARNARLYIYWTWGKKGAEGSDAEVEVTFNDRKLSQDRQYTDQKGYGSNNYPSGTYCYNVTNYIEDGNGSKINYTTVVKNTGKDHAKFAICGVNLVAVYEDSTEPEIEYWINEGCDMIYETDDDGVEITSEDATTNIFFSGVIDLAEVKKATLITVVPSGDKGNNELGFNNETWDEDVYNGDPYDDLAIDKRDVVDHLRTSGNYAYIMDKGDYMVPSNALLILESGQKVPKLDQVAVVVGEITDMGIHYISDDTYGAVFGTIMFAIYDLFDRVAGYREAEDIRVYAVPSDCDPDYNMWMNVTETNEPKRTLTIFDDPYTNETQDYETEICFFDENDDGNFDDDNETYIYRTTTSYDGTFAIQLDGGMYDIYARY